MLAITTRPLTRPRVSPRAVVASVFLLVAVYATYVWVSPYWGWRQNVDPPPAFSTNLFAVVLTFTCWCTGMLMALTPPQCFRGVLLAGVGVFLWVMMVDLSIQAQLSPWVLNMTVVDLKIRLALGAAAIVTLVRAWVVIFDADVPEDW